MTNRGRLDVRFGSLADIGVEIRDVRFAPESGHTERQHRRPLSAISGRWGGNCGGALETKRATGCKRQAYSAAFTYTSMGGHEHTRLRSP